ncbi:hypothetical protein F5878DRAFT_19622 [Lentinula raphanica]|uniref:C2H2-type domain-containing protein n=1 Tax=Lentinula raphanica TaxID=153919 RepID=A0AA38PEB7_9AGAR|nr:hypothetical protein F5878DRAFT_19622 [Lentinula raphanica]
MSLALSLENHSSGYKAAIMDHCRSLLPSNTMTTFNHSFSPYESSSIIAHSNVAPEQLTGVRRTRKELFVDGDDLTPVPIHEPPRVHLSPALDPHRSLVVGAVANLLEESGQVDPMDVWRTYTKRSEDDKNGRTPLTCIWPVGHNDECGYGATPKLMRRHVQTTHMHIKRYRCDICDQAFSQGALLHSHKASKHAQIRPYKCPFEGCQKSYVDCPTLLRHKKINHNYVPKPITRYR